jgi:hypothetical protein
MKLMTIKSSKSRALSLARLASTGLAVLVMGLLSLFVHDFALLHLNIPYPRETPIPTVVRALEMLLVVLGMIWFVRLASFQLAVLSPLRSGALVVLLVVMLNELFRIVLITTTLANHGWSHAYYVFAVARYGPKIAAQAVLAACVVVVARRRRRPRDWFLTAVILAAVGAFLLLPSANAVSAWSTAHFLPFDAENRYDPPYPASIYAVIYATYIEPTVAAFAMAGVVWPGLRGSLLNRAATFCLVLLLIHNRIGQFVIESFWVEVPSIPLRFAATGQFVVETTVLGLACPLIWGLFVAGTRQP